MDTDQNNEDNGDDDGWDGVGPRQIEHHLSKHGAGLVSSVDSFSVRSASIGIDSDDILTNVEDAGAHSLALSSRADSERRRLLQMSIHSYPQDAATEHQQQCRAGQR